MPNKEMKETKNNLPSVNDYSSYANQGFEGTDQDDIVIPFIGVLQGLSPQCETREDCSPGMLFNTVTEESTGGEEGILFVPAVVGLKEYVEWVPRKRGGGLVARHKPESAAVGEAQKDAAERGLPFGKLELNSAEGPNDLVETKYIYGVQIDEATEEPMGFFCLGFTSSKIKVFNSFNTRLQTVKGTPPPFAHLCRLTTVKEKNSEGDYYNFKLSAAKGSIMESLLPVDSAAFKAGLDCHSMVTGGQVTTAYESQQKTGDNREDGSGVF